MNNKIKREIKLSILKRLTGRQDPSKIRIIISILIVIIAFIITLIAGFFLNPVIKNIFGEIKITATISPYIQEGKDGDFLPLILTNIGDKTIHNIKVGVITPANEKSEVYDIPFILPNKQEIIPFGNKDAIKDFEQISCSPYSIKPPAEVSYTFGSNLTNTTSTIICGYCNYTVFIFSNEINTSINSSYRCPVNITLSLGPAH